MRILITNDDGIHSKGIKILADIARKITDDVYVVAPSNNVSGYSHAVTINHPIKCTQVNDKEFAISGTPADCVIMALENIMVDKKPDLVISGINEGSNLSDNIVYSATLGAAFEAKMHNLPAIAISQAHYRNSADSISWIASQHYTLNILKKIISHGLSTDSVININMPAVNDAILVKGAIVVPHETINSNKKVFKIMSPNGTHYYWIHGYDSNEYGAISDISKITYDTMAIENNYISITPLKIWKNHKYAIEEMQKIDFSDII